MHVLMDLERTTCTHLCLSLYLSICQPKKKNTTAYQVFCKEYRVNINAEQPGLGKHFILFISV